MEIDYFSWEGSLTTGRTNMQSYMNDFFYNLKDQDVFKTLQPFSQVKMLIWL